MTDPRETTSGIELKPVYGPRDLAEWDGVHQLGEPGSYPFTRGIHAEMYRKRLWTIRQYAGFGSAEDTNARFQFLVRNGQTGLSLAFDLPTQLGLDSDHPETLGEVGRLGVAIDTLDDMRRLYEGIPLDGTSTSMTINATAPVILAMYVAVADEQNVPRSELRGTVQNDVFKEYLARGLFVFPPEPSLRLAGDVIEFCIKELPRFNPVSVSAPHIRSAGARYPSALAYMLLAAQLMVEEVVRRDIDVDAVGRRITFLAGADNDFFETVCRHRASRRLWARLMREQYGAADPAAMMYRLAGTGNPLNLTYRQPLNNLARITLQGLANILGGCQSLVLPCWDEAYAIPTEDAVRLSLNIQRVLALESGVPNVVDPLAGSYFVESLTDEVERLILSEMERVQERGGLIASITDGWIQREMAQRAFEQESEIQNGTRPVVGVNCYIDEDEDTSHFEAEMHVVDAAVADAQRATLGQVRSVRDSGEVEARISAVTTAIHRGENVMPALIEAVTANATIGELTDALAAVAGKHRAPSPV